MKKLFYVISTVALMASFASCNKIEQGNNPSADGTTTLTVSAAVPMTKTYWNQGLVKWSSGDVISILAEGYAPVKSNKVETATETYNFEVNGWYADVVPQYAAFTGADAEPVWKDGTIQMTVPDAQNISNQGSFSKIANISLGELLAGDEASYSTQLKNVCGLLKFTLSNPTRSVVFEDVNGKPMSGKVNVKMENDLPAIIGEVIGGAGITVASNINNSNMPEEDEKVHNLAHDKARSYYAVVIPGTYTPKVTITPVNGDPIVITAQKEITVVRNKYIDLGTLDVETMSITVEMPYPFNENLPLSETKSKDTYTLKDTDYTFVVNNQTTYYRLTNSTLRLTGANESIGYIQFPEVKGMTLIGFDITSGNGTNAKEYSLYAKDPIEVTVGNSAIATFTLKNEDPYHVALNETSEGVGYFLASDDKNAQFRKLVLTYAKDR